MNSNIQKAIKYVNGIYMYGTDFYHDKEVNSFWEGKTDILWQDLCAFAHLKLRGYIFMHRFTLGLLIFLLENNSYNGDYKDKLLRDLSVLKELYAEPKWNISTIFNDRYDEIVYASAYGADVIGIRRISNNNQVLKDLFVQFIRETRATNHQSNAEIDYCFPLSAGNQEIVSYKDINSQTFWTQIGYYQNLYNEDEKLKDKSIKTVCRFYRWLITKYSEYDFFAGSSNMSTELMLSNALVKNINRGTYITTLSKDEDLADKPLICFIIRNLDTYSTRFKKVDHFILSTEILNSSLYRTLINKYVQNSTSVSEATWCGFINYASSALHFLEQLKAQKNYPNPDLEQINTSEAVLIRNFFEKSYKVQLATLNNRIGAARRFFQWSKSCGYLKFDDTFFDYLSQYEEPNKYHGDSIPENDLTSISDTFRKLCKEDESYLPYYAIFLLQIETEFRISHICSLKTSSIQPTLKDDQFLLYSNTKTSNGRKPCQPISLSTKKLLEHVIELSQDLRDACVSTAYSEHIFLMKGYNNSITPINSSTFRSVFQKICDMAGTKLYNSRNLRDTHMTKAFEFIMKNGKSDLEMGLLSKHTHIDTTKSHYIEMELTKMLESTYQITLGSRDINHKSHILDDLPESTIDKSAVEGGCGHCDASSCQIQGTTPCLICNHFFTTVNHAPYFLKMIAAIDEMLNKSTIPHQVEDLTLMKTLYVNWLRELYLHKEENNADIDAD